MREVCQHSGIFIAHKINMGQLEENEKEAIFPTVLQQAGWEESHNSGNEPLLTKCNHI